MCVASAPVTETPSFISSTRALSARLTVTESNLQEEEQACTRSKDEEFEPPTPAPKEYPARGYDSRHARRAAWVMVERGRARLAVAEGVRKERLAVTVVEARVGRGVLFGQRRARGKHLVRAREARLVEDHPARVCCQRKRSRSQETE